MSKECVISYELMQTIMRLPRQILEIQAGDAYPFGYAPTMIESAISTVQNESFLAGVEHAYNTCWDVLQENGSKTNYDYFFYKWADGVCYPKHKMCVSSASQMFRGCKVSNLKECLRDTLDTSNCQNFYYMFAEALTSATPKVVIPHGTNLKALDGAFSWCPNLVSVEIEFNEGVGAYPSLMFNGSAKLKEIKVSGVIANGGLHFYNNQSLSKQSMTNIINILSDHTNGLDIAFPRNAVNKEFETGNNWWNGTSSTEWLNLVASKPNWTISLL